METNVDDTSPNPKWDVSTSVPFKILIIQYQDILTLIHMAKTLYGVQSRRKYFIYFMLSV